MGILAKVWDCVLRPMTSYFPLPSHSFMHPIIREMVIELQQRTQLMLGL